MLSRLQHYRSAIGSTLIRNHIRMSSIKIENYYADAKAPIVSLSAKSHFNELTSQERKYAHYMSRASHWGTRVVLRSVSPESEVIYDLIISIHKHVNSDYSDLTKHLGEVAVQQYLEFASQFLSNLGNYKSFGDVKFIPRLPRPDFETLVEWTNSETVLQLFELVKDDLYSLDEKNILLGWNTDGHVSSYYLNKVSKVEAEVVNAALASKGIMPENTRVEKLSDSEYRVHVASADISNNTGYYPDSIDYKDADGKSYTITFKFGDHAAEFSQIVSNLVEAKKYAANETQVKLLEHYIQSFTTGSMNAHKDSQIEWVRDIGPSVETNIGFIETYRDPSGVRGEWEGLVAMVNKERTEKFQKLVSSAKHFIQLLPWPKAFEKDVFTPPDFTSLEVLTFAGSGIPAGINIPNYDDVRINIGFKNVSLGNILSARSASEPVTFIDESLVDVFNKYRSESFEVQVGIHELLGHGTGKLLQETGDNSYNFDINSPPIGLDGKPVSTFYKKGETWGSVFGSIAGSAEECRAESVAMFLVTNRELLEIFGYSTKEEQDNIIHISFLQMARAGLVALEQWDPKTRKWGQPHMQARYAILRTFLDAGEDFVTLKYTKGGDFSDLRIELDESKISTVGQKAIGNFLQQLHILKCSADVNGLTKLYNSITTVTEEIAQFRDTILAKRLPRKQYIQGNTLLEDDTAVVKEYAENEIGLIQSFVDRDV
ncbi:GQ67_01822T0 [Komagataella phaffii]|nr:GQ67_01822T0 [Komagataella phaffii]AOA66128.1 GQ68_01838T0 [Komagataella phaffii GS115]